MWFNLPFLLITALFYLLRCSHSVYHSVQRGPPKALHAHIVRIGSSSPVDAGIPCMIIYSGSGTFHFRPWLKTVVHETETKSRLQANQNFFTPVVGKTFLGGPLRARVPILGVEHPSGNEGCAWVVLKDLFSKSPHIEPWFGKIADVSGGILPERAWVHHAKSYEKHQHGFDNKARLETFMEYVANITQRWPNRTLSLNGVNDEDVVIRVHTIKVCNIDEIIAVRECSRFIAELRPPPPPQASTPPFSPQRSSHSAASLFTPPSTSASSSASSSSSSSAFASTFQRSSYHR